MTAPLYPKYENGALVGLREMTDGDLRSSVSYSTYTSMYPCIGTMSCKFMVTDIRYTG